jgi:two-component system chemotaxis response regulator CheY
MDMKEKTILLIEDSKSTRLTYRKAFEDAGFQVLEAENGTMGWEKTKQYSPDLIVLDLLLPDMHGLEVLQKIRIDKYTTDIPVLVLTDVKEAEEVQKTKNFGASYYAHKGSVTPARTIKIAEKLLKKSQKE